VKWHKVIRIVCLLAAAGGVGLLIHRLNRSPEQKELTRYVEVEVPAILSLEQAIQQRIDRLGQAPGLKPEEARTLLVDDVIPRLIKLKKQVGDLKFQTVEVRELNDEYIKVTDRLIDACRACVKVIDDPKVSTVDGMKQVRSEFDAVRTAYQTWDDHVRTTAKRHRLSK
jgi:hypothetical protein